MTASTTTLSFSSSTTEILPGASYIIGVSAGPEGSPPTDVTLEFTANKVSADITQNSGFTPTSATLDFTGRRAFLTDSVTGAPIEGNPAFQTVNFDQLTSDNFQLFDASVTLNGETLKNTGTVDMTSQDRMAINADIKGDGMFFIQFGSALTLNDSVGRHQTFDMGPGSTLNVNDPHSFYGHVNVIQSSTEGFFGVNLAGLVATSYDYNDDVLTLFANDQVIDRLSFTDSAGFTVFNSPSGVAVSNDLSNPGLPVHTHNAGV